jgi:hypothetical protein
MKATRKTWTPEDYEQATNKADDLGMKLYGLAQVVRLAAFAAEARRTLTGIEGALEWREDVRTDLRDHIHQMTGWQDMPDTAGDALQFIASELDQAHEDFTALSYRLANRLREQSEQVHSDGGRIEGG